MEVPADPVLLRAALRQAILDNRAWVEWAALDKDRPGLHTGKSLDISPTEIGRWTMLMMPP